MAGHAMMQDGTKLLELRAAGQSPWCDHLNRDMVDSGELRRLVSDLGVVGLTSNPTIFQKSLAAGERYDLQIRRLTQRGLDVNMIYEQVAVSDVQAAADMLCGVYESSDAVDGYVSLEVSPELAHDAPASVAEARRLRDAVNRPNLMVKIPATQAGLEAITELLGEGTNVNATLVFGLQRYRDLLTAFARGLEIARTRRSDVHRIASVASFFVSRVDTLVDSLLEEKMRTATDAEQRAELAALRGTAAIANARAAYGIWRSFAHSEQMLALAAFGARPQRLLWASTSTKNPAYGDVRYVEELVGPHTVNTMPLETIAAFVDHGTVRPDALTRGIADAAVMLRSLERAGIDMERVAADLEETGVRIFADSFALLRDELGKRMAGVTRLPKKPATAPAPAPRPIFIGVGGDSGTGKSTLVRAFYALFGEDRIASLCLDDYHSLDRRQRGLVGLTALDPRANNFALLEEHVWAIKRGEHVDKPIYDHSDGTLKGPERLDPREVVIIQGLHTFLVPGIRHAFDLKLWLDPQPELRVEWKIQRDVAKRGYDEKEVLAELEARRPDAEAYIAPQRRFADLIVSFYRRKPDEDMGRLSVRVTSRHTLPRLNAERELLRAKSVRLLQDVLDEDGQRSDIIEIDGDISLAEATLLEKHIWAHIDGRHGTLHYVSAEKLGGFEEAARRQRHSDPLALTQLIVAHRILSAQKSYLVRVTAHDRETMANAQHVTPM